MSARSLSMVKARPGVRKRRSWANMGNVSCPIGRDYLPLSRYRPRSAFARSTGVRPLGGASSRLFPYLTLCPSVPHIPRPIALACSKRFPLLLAPTFRFCFSPDRRKEEGPGSKGKGTGNGGLMCGPGRGIVRTMHGAMAPGAAWRSSV